MGITGLAPTRPAGDLIQGKSAGCAGGCDAQVNDCRGPFGRAGGHAGGRAANPAGFVDSLVSDALVVIKDESLGDQDRQARFEALLQHGFDMPRIARFVLGRYWTAASDDQRQAFAQLFEHWVVQTYASRLKAIPASRSRSPARATRARARW